MIGCTFELDLAYMRDNSLVTSFGWQYIQIIDCRLDYTEERENPRNGCPMVHYYYKLTIKGYDEGFENETITRLGDEDFFEEVDAGIYKLLRVSKEMEQYFKEFTLTNKLEN